MATEAQGRATLSEVAALARVSVSTVSKVLNGRPGVSPETRAAIENILQDRRYNRRNSVQNSSQLIDVLCYDFGSPFASAAMAGIEAVTRGQGLGVVVAGTDDRHMVDSDWVESVVRRQPIGVVLIATELTQRDRQRLRSRNIPIVAVDPSGTPDADMPSIGSADWNGGFLATRHLIELGHREIAIITGPDDMMAATARLSGYRAALEAAGLEVRPGFVRPGRFRHEDGLSQGLALLGGDSRPTAIFASSDLQALGVYEAARTLGVSIPDDLSVVGYDDLAISRWIGPPLTTIQVPLVQMVEQAIRLVLRLHEDPSQAFSRVDVATSLVVRKSTVPPRGA